MVIGSRYDVGDMVLFKGQPAVVIGIERTTYGWGIRYGNIYNIKIPSGDIIKEVRASELRLVKGAEKKTKRLPFKTMPLPDNWKFWKSISSNYYRQKEWIYETLDEKDMVSIFQIEDGSFIVTWAINRTSFAEFRIKGIKTAEEAAQIAKEKMVELNEGKIEKPAWAR